MRTALLAGIFVYIFLFVATTFVQSPEAVTLAREAGFSTEEIDRGLQYSFERRLFYWSAMGVRLALLAAVVFSGLGRRVADFCAARTGGRWLLTVLMVGGLFFVADELLAIPFSLARLHHTRAWGMTDRTVLSWLQDFGMRTAVSAAIGAVVLVGFFLLLRWSPRRWWIPATVGAALLGIFGAYLHPVLISPLFNTFTPLSETKWSDLEPSVRQLADKAKIHVDEVYVVDASRQSNFSNAYFTGIGASQQIVLYDNLLKRHTAAEVESVLGHEMGHWQHMHLLKGIALATLASLVGFFLLSRILRWAVGRPPFNLDSPSDPASIPLILLLSFVGSWAIMPVENAISRRFERQADRAALELAGRPKVFVDAERRLARDNIGNVAPSPFSVWLFSSHPPAVERIRMAEEWSRSKPD